MKRLGVAVFCLFAFLVMTAATAAERSRDIYVNGKFLISSYNVDGKHVVAFNDLAKLVAGAGTLTIDGGKVKTVVPQTQRAMGSVLPKENRLKIKNAVVLGNVFSNGGQQWILLADLVKQLGGKQAVPTSRLGAGVPIQIRVFDCPDVQCCPDCGIAIR
jgi:hypothetical protein